MVMGKVLLLYVGIRAHGFEKYNSTKICVCTPVKEENRYIREFEQHYERNIVDKIFIYDNNDITGEKIEDELKDYISKGFVEVLN